MVAHIMQADAGSSKVDRPLKRRVGYDETNEPRNSGDGEEHGGSSTRPTVKRRYGYFEEKVNEATEKLSDMEIDGMVPPSKSSDRD